jgi:hypothetical protein
MEAFLHLTETMIKFLNTEDTPVLKNSLE